MNQTVLRRLVPEALPVPKLPPRFRRYGSSTELKPQVCFLDEITPSYEVHRTLVITKSDSTPPSRDECLMAITREDMLYGVCAMRDPLLIHPDETRSGYVFRIDLYKVDCSSLI